MVAPSLRASTTFFARSRARCCETIAWSSWRLCWRSCTLRPPWRRISRMRTRTGCPSAGRRHEAAGLAVANELGRAADGGADDRRADGEGLRDDLRHRLRLDRGQHEHVEGGHDLGHVAAEAGHDHVRLQIHLLHAAPHVVEADAVADDQEARVGTPDHDGARGLEEVRVALAAADVGHETDGGAAQAELGAYTGA